MLNNQPIEKVVRDSEALEVHSIFPTIQGEGPFVGTPCVFIRLAGCQLQCPLCDTDYTSSREKLRTEEIIREVRNHRPNGLVVVTGGEPFRQPIGKLILSLRNNGYYVQVETNGTLPPPFESVFHTLYDTRYGAFIVISPKTGYVHPLTAKWACAFKYVLDGDDWNQDDGLPTKALGHVANPQLARPPSDFKGPVYLQPADTKDPTRNEKNLATVVRNVHRYPGLTLGLQIHKILGVA